MRKSQLEQPESKTNLFDHERSELTKLLSPKQVKSTAAQTESHGDDDRWSEKEEIESDGKMLIQTVLLMSNELRSLNKRIFDIEQCLYDWMKDIQVLVRSSNSEQKQTKEETESREVQCNLTPKDPTVATNLSYAQVTKGLSTKASNGAIMSEHSPPKMSEVELKVRRCRQQVGEGNETTEENDDVPGKSQACDETQKKGPTNHKHPEPRWRKKVSRIPDGDSADKPQAQNLQKKEKEMSPETDDDDRPKVLCIHDSMLKRVDPQRLGKSYGLRVARAPAYYVDKVESTTKEQVEKLGEPDAILIHTGINNLKSEDPKQAAMKLVNAVKSIKSNTPKAKIVVSCVATCNYTNLDHKKAIFNAVVTSELFNQERIQVLQHRNFQPHHLREDKIHPDHRGTAVLASNIGRVIHSLFYTVVTRKRNHRKFDYWYDHIEEY